MPCVRVCQVLLLSRRRAGSVLSFISQVTNHVGFYVLPALLVQRLEDKPVGLGIGHREVGHHGVVERGQVCAVC